MNKVFSVISDFSYKREDESTTMIAWGYEEKGDGKHATWYETPIYKKQNPHPTFEDIKNTVLTTINKGTDDNILNGFTWNEKPVYLSSENQFNFKAAYDLAVQTQGQSLPVTFKLGEKDGTPVYHTFKDMTEFTDFYTKAMAYIQQCLANGWQIKDSIDWDKYIDLKEES